MSILSTIYTNTQAQKRVRKPYTARQIIIDYPKCPSYPKGASVIAAYGVLKVTKCHKISEIVLSTQVTEIISFNFVVYYRPLLKSGGPKDI